MRNPPSFLVKTWHYVANSLLFETLFSVVTSVCAWLFQQTHFATSKLLARKPAPPQITVIDRRCNRIRLKFAPKRTSLFNKDAYEVQHMPARGLGEADEWISDPETEEESRIVAPLLPDTTYAFRVRTRNAKGTSDWSQMTCASTLHRPVEGGASLPGYTWTQSGIEVAITCSIPSCTRAKDITVDLSPQYLRVAHRTLDSTEVLVNGKLPQRVRSLTPQGTSYWELNRDGAECSVSVIMEKEQPARNIKFDFWHSAFEGDPEVDTHYIESDPYVRPMQPVGDMPAHGPQRRQFDRHDAFNNLYSKMSKGELDMSSMPIAMQQLYKQ